MGFKRTGYVFSGWAFSSTAVTPDLAALSNFEPWGNVTLYAVWTHVVSTVSYDANGGSGRMDSQQVSTDAVTLTPNSFTNGSKTFTGWAKKPTAKHATISDGASLPVSGNVTLYAIWH